jgi:hypothetical protein
MDTDVVLKLKWTGGASKIARVHRTDVLSDVLTTHGFTAPEGFDIFIAHRGSLLGVDFSLQFHGINTGDHLVCVLKKLPSKDKSRQFLDSVAPARRIFPQYTPVTDSSDVNCSTEQARLNDISFRVWESLPGLPAVMNDLLKELEEQIRENPSSVDLCPANVTESREMSEAPLPNPFHTDSNPWNGVFKSSYEWGARCVKDIPDQFKHGDFFDDLKK